jgi:glycine/D-amino acid oxidase-like deaminating enzyme
VQVDYIIVGQGISGTLLSWNLLKAGKSFIVVDNGNPFSSSRVASGLINPVTGKRHVKSWLYDSLIPVALDTYHELANELDVDLLKPCDILQFHTSPEERDIFHEKAAVIEHHLSVSAGSDWQDLFQVYLGVGAIHPCWLIDGDSLLGKWRELLEASDFLLQEEFRLDNCSISNEQIIYGDVKASKIIFCDGTATAYNPYFSLLPFSINKGEVIIARIPDLPREDVYKQQLKIVPWKDDLFWIGSSFEWKYDQVSPTEKFRAQAEYVLKNWLKLPYEIVDQFASERPSTVDYKPFVGLHPVHPAVGILNGMGTKGYSQAPFFAKQLADLLVHGTEVMPDVSIHRYKGILNRTNA